MAHYHFTVRPISRREGKSTVAPLAYRSATDLKDFRNGQTYYYAEKKGADVFHVGILLPEEAPQWIVDIAHECKTNRQSALQKLSVIIEATEKRRDARVYREVEFSLPNELTDKQNIEWSQEFVQDFFCTKGMMAIVNYHHNFDKQLGIYKPHCHVLLSTRNLTEHGFSRYKNLDWNSRGLVEEGREQYAVYQNAALERYGFDDRVTHLSYEDRELDVDAQTKLSKRIREMTRRGIVTDKQKIFDFVRLKNQFKIIKNPEIVFDIVTSHHATFTRKDVAKVLNRYIDNAEQFQILLERLMTSKELITLKPKAEQEAKKKLLGTPEERNEQKEKQAPIKEREPVYTTRKIVQVELDLIKTAETLAARKTHPVAPRIIEKVVAKYHKEFKERGGLSADQEHAIRHMLSGEQMSCVIGYAGAGKTTCLKAVNEAWQKAGYSVLGLAPTGKAERSIAACGIRSMTVHRFLKSQEQGREKISKKTIVVLDEAGMLDSRRFFQLQTIVAKARAKIVPMGDNNQNQAVEAGPPFRLITHRIESAVVKTIVRQQVDWQREASRLFGDLQPRKALKLYQENGCFYGIKEQKPDLADRTKTVSHYCLARQVSGRIWKEMLGDIRAQNRKKGRGDEAPVIDFEAISHHQDYAVHTHWKNMRNYFVQSIIQDFGIHKGVLEARGVNGDAFAKLVVAYQAAEEEKRGIIFEQIETILRKMSYENSADTRMNTRQALVEAWAADREVFPNHSHLMLAFTKEDAHKLNEAARTLMKKQDVITGIEITYKTQTIEEDDFGVEYRKYHDRTFAKGDRILFTRNDKGLEVSNGSLGTILSLKKNKIKVLLDGGKKQKTVSFAPKLYPFFDHGWATTVRKAQSVTVDHVKFLGAWQDYRNLAYVALTRHCYSLKVFFSDLDFWRPEKLIDRLSSIQEKLSGIDYLGVEQLQDQLTEDTKILWHHWPIRKVENYIQQGKDLWAAIKVTAQDVRETIAPSQDNDDDEIAVHPSEEAFLSLEDSEEIRSRDFFEDLELAAELECESEIAFEEASQSKVQPHKKNSDQSEYSSSQKYLPRSFVPSDTLPYSTPHSYQKKGTVSEIQISETRASATRASSAIGFNRLKNQDKIIKNPEIILEIVTTKQSTFVKQDIARVLNEHIDDRDLFRALYDRLSHSKELVELGESADGKPVFTTKGMLRTERDLITQAETLATKTTHPVAPDIIERVIAKYHKKFEEHGGLSPDQERAIRHMLSGEQISCVVGFAGAGKTTCLEAVKEAWEEAGYSILGLAPTGKAERSIAACGIWSMTVHKFLKDHEGEGKKIPIPPNTIIVIDEAGMVDSRRLGQTQSLVAESGAKIVLIGDNNQLQSIEAGPAYRLVCYVVKPAVLETIVRQHIPWQKEATCLFGMRQPRQALALYQREGTFATIQEVLPDFNDPDQLIEVFCLCRQISGRIWQEIKADYKAVYGTSINFEQEDIFEIVSKHQDFDLYATWKDNRKAAVRGIIETYDQQRPKLEELGADMEKLDERVADYHATPPEENKLIFNEIEKILRKMSYEHIADTRIQTKQALVAAWAADLEAAPEQSHLMLAFTNRDTKTLNELARLAMREKGKITGLDHQFVTKSIEKDDFGNVDVILESRQFAQGDRILFTLNNKKLGVTNGSLGTILSLDQKTITVAMDAEASEKKELSFSPTEYPFIDNGWATNIHKAQSTTAGDVKLLGSFEQYRNMVYVAMTRHRNSLKVYFSNLDFWREEKIFDRLSRVQEKLSGFDYLDKEAIAEKLRYEKDASSEESIQDNLLEQNKFGKDLKLLDENKKIDLLDEDYLHLDDTEEKRSSDIFKERDTRDRGAFATTEKDEATSKSNKTKKGGRKTKKAVPSTQHPPSSLSKDNVDERIKAVIEKINSEHSSQTIATQAPRFVGDRQKNQSRIIQDPEVILEIVTAKHSTFVAKDIERVLNEHIDDRDLFRALYDRLSHSKELVKLGESADGKPVFTTKGMLRIEKDLVDQAEMLATKTTHPVAPDIIERVIAKYHKKFEEHGGLSADQERAIRHMLSGEQISCVIGFAGAGKTTCLEAVKEAWEEAGYSVLGLAPTGKAERSIAACGIRSMTVHKFLNGCEEEREPLSSNTIIVIDEAGMVDSRRFGQIQSLVAESGAKIVPIGDNNQLQSIEAGPAYRLICHVVKLVALEMIIRQRIPWQQEATRLFGMKQPRQALALYQQKGAFTIIQEAMPDFNDPDQLIEVFCLCRQISGRIWKEINEDYKAVYGKSIDFKQKGTFEIVSTHKDYDLHDTWKDRRQSAVEKIIETYDQQRPKLEELGADMKELDKWVANYHATPSKETGPIFSKIAKILRKMSYEHIADTRVQTKQALVAAWAADFEAAPERTHLMLAFTNRDTKTLNELARLVMREKGKIVGSDYLFETKSIEKDDFGNAKIIRKPRQFAQGDRIVFTTNDEELGVANGSLGTIVSLDQKTITVAMDTDASEKRELSFSPTEYPFIDNGWATNIHKAQSATAGDVKLLGSFEQYRNMVYVAMTRHRNSLKVYFSNLDFWREEKIFDRLSGVQEKLSGLDYLDKETIAEKLAPEDSTLKNLLEVSSSLAKEPIFNKPPPIDEDKKIDLLDENYLHLEDTEEKRSGDIFKDPNARDKDAFVTTKDEAASKGNKTKKVKGEAKKTGASAPSSSLGKDGIDERIKAAKEKIRGEYDYEIVAKNKPLSFKEIEDQLKERIVDLAKGTIDKPILSNTPRELRFGKDREIRVVLIGKYQGFYQNFESGVKGGPLKLIEDQQGLSFREALEWAAKWLGGNQVVIERHAVAKKQEAKDKGSEWKPVFSIPKEAQHPDIAGNKYLNIMLKDGWKEGGRYAYRDEAGNLKGYVVRLEKPDGDKVDKKMPLLAFCENEKGQRAWRWLSFEKENKTPYKIESLSPDPHKPVLVVEGEKTADAAQRLLPEYDVLTWGGGAGNVDKTNWQCLVGKETIVIWPDYDYDHTSQKAAHKLQKILTQLNKAAGKEGRIGVVDLLKYIPNPHALPDKWDLADKLPEGWELDTVCRIIHEAVPHQDKDIGAQRLDHGDHCPSSAKEHSSADTQMNPLVEKREQFEKSRLAFHQEWCANLGFFCQHKRFPKNEEEISAAYWQGERLTAIEGRLYGEVLAKGKRRIDEEKLTLQARDELVRNQSVPDHIMTFGQASDLTENQLKQFEQHVLMHQDKTGQFPIFSELNVLCQAIKVHNQLMNVAGPNRRAEKQNPTTAQIQSASESEPHRNPSLNASSIYRTLIEQQALLTNATNKGKEIYKADKMVMERISSQQLKPQEIHDLCSDRLKRMNEKIQQKKAFIQEMKILEMNRQNQRGMDI